MSNYKITALMVLLVSVIVGMELRVAVSPCRLIRVDFTPDPDAEPPFIAPGCQ
jgi:hypothetical protein